MPEDNIIFYTDDDVHGGAIHIARENGVDLITSNEAGLLGAHDPVHFAHATENDYVLVSANIRDFKPLFDEWVAGGNAHPGMVLITSKHQKNAVHIARKLSEIQTETTKEEAQYRVWYI